MANQEKYTILYGRLSQEDEREGESNSIQNQRMMLEKYAVDNGFTNLKFLYDDGYSGTNFNRPAWKEVMELVESDQVSTLIVKDMSRLGRDYLLVGQYTEMIFPSYGVRFIAVNNNVDSLYGDNDFTPFVNLFNDFYAKDTSRKIRAVKKAQAERGERIGTRPPYGYRKSENNPKQIVPDEQTADGRRCTAYFPTLCQGQRPQPDCQATESGTGSDAHQLLLPADRSSTGESGYGKAI